MPREQPTEDEEKQILAMLSAAMKAPRPQTINEKLSVAEILRKWMAVVLMGLLFAGVGIWEASRLRAQVDLNTKRVTEDHRRLQVLWWMKENGWTNKDVEPTGPIRLPQFD